MTAAPNDQHPTALPPSVAVGGRSGGPEGHHPDPGGPDAHSGLAEYALLLARIEHGAHAIAALGRHLGALR